MMTRIIPVIASAGPDPWLVAWLNVWATPILLDPNWNGGDYYDRAPPAAGLAQAIKIIALQANQYQWTDAAYRLTPARERRQPAAAFANKFAVEAAFEDAGAARAAVADANHLLYLVKANQTFVPGAGAGAKTAAEGMRRIKAPALSSMRRQTWCSRKNGSRRPRARWPTMASMSKRAKSPAPTAI